MKDKKHTLPIESSQSPVIRQNEDIDPHLAYLDQSRNIEFKQIKTDVKVKNTTNNGDKQ